MGLSRGARIGSCEILAQLGTGGMGEVYRARDTKLDRDVAVKSLPDVFAHDADRLARFEREAQMLAALNHPNIAAIYDLVEFSGSKYLVLELVEGDTLADRLERAPLPIDEAIDIALQIAEALEAAHEKGIVHRDLKPANVKITPGGRVKVLDFGLAKIHESAMVSSNLSNSPTLGAVQSAAGVILGTAAYMSPEQARGKAVDKRSDIWAFGCIVYEMLTARQTFPNGETVSDTLAGILAREPDWEALPPATPPKLRTLLERCLRKDSRRRLHDIADARIEMEETRAEPPVAPLEARASAALRRRLYAVAAVAALLLLTSAALAIRAFRALAPDAPAVRFDVFPPEGFTFRANTQPNSTVAPWPRLSPDGRKLSFVASAESKQLLWVRPIDSSTAQALPGTDEAANSFWSPDSNYIAFITPNRLKKVAASGGPAQVLCNLETMREGTWGTEGVILLSQQNGPLFRVSAAGGEPAPATELDASRKETQHREPNFLPDGRHFTYVAVSSDPQKTGTFIGSLDSKERRPLPGIASVSLHSPSGHMVFLRDGTLMAQPFDLDRLELSGDALPVAEQISNAQAGAFSISQAGGLVYRAGATFARSQLVWFDRSGKQLEVASPEGEYHEVRLSPDGRYVAFPRGTPPDIWVLELQRGIISRLTSDPANDVSPVWSPDGRTIVFYSNRDGSNNLYQRPFGVVAKDAILLRTETGKVAQSWSRDGRYLAYISPQNDSDIWVFPFSNESTPVRVTETPFDETNVVISPDSQWIAYAANENGQYEIYIQSFPKPGVRRQVSTSGGFGTRWSYDGNELFYITPDGTLMAVPIRSVGSSLEAGSPHPLFQTRLATVAPGQFARQYDVAPDGRFLMNVTSEDRFSSPITVILNWAAGLKK